jgi:16S rRNA (guanine966-N2)-methyltransferase
MRIIAGRAKGMPLATPRGGVRPTSGRVRQAIFSSLGGRVAGARVLDLFAGTGALGLEAASRGAASVTFVENARDALTSLEKNVEEFGRRFCGADTPSAALEIRRDDVSVVLSRMAAARERVSLIFADPPYGAVAQELLADENLPFVLGVGGTLVLESARRERLMAGRPWERMGESIYGDTRVSFLRTKAVIQ